MGRVGVVLRGSMCLGVYVELKCADMFHHIYIQQLDFKLQQKNKEKDIMFLDNHIQLKWTFFSC